MSIQFPKAFRGEEIAPDAHEKLNEALGWASDFVKRTGFAAGTDHATLADIVFMGTYGVIRATGHVRLEKYPALEQWFRNMQKAIPK